MKTLVQVELTRHNVTPAQFLAYVRATLKRKGVRDYGSDLDLDYFARGNDLNFDYRNDPEKPCKAEKSISRPYEMQTYILNWDGSCYNEICEFEFDDEKTGHGYYYLVNTEAEPAEDEPKEENTMSLYEKMTAELEAQKDRSAWSRGVKAYALELVEELEERAAYEGRNPEPGKECREWMLNGAQDWNQYSWGGSSLIYDADIAERLCTPSELKKTRNGERRPNSREEWLDTQARALFQACNLVSRLYRSMMTA